MRRGLRLALQQMPDDHRGDVVGNIGNHEIIPLFDNLFWLNIKDITMHDAGCCDKVR